MRNILPNKLAVEEEKNFWDNQDAVPDQATLAEVSDFSLLNKISELFKHLQAEMLVKISQEQVVSSNVSSTVQSGRELEGYPVAPITDPQKCLQDK